MIDKDVQNYSCSLDGTNKLICDLLSKTFTEVLPEAENKVWHGHPVWFLDGNPVVGYAVRKSGVQVLFWSGQSFDEEGLVPEGSFKAAQIHYTSADQVNKDNLKRWLEKAKSIQWDYKNIVKRKGVLERLK